MLCNGPCDPETICSRSTTAYELERCDWQRLVQLVVQQLVNHLVPKPNSSTITKERSVATLRMHAA